jgi:hypothetical protein
MGKDLVIGAVSNYEYDKIEPWLTSLKRTGYKGNIALVAYNMSAETVAKLTEKNVHYIFGLQKDDAGNFKYENKHFSIMIERFVHMWYFLNNMEEETDFVFTTDVRDVIFQTNPSDWIEKNLTSKKKLFVATENMRYQDEPWGKNNMLQAFGPLLYEQMKSEPIYCAGVIAGEKKSIMDFFLNVFLMCRGAPAHVAGGGGPDQAALNITLNLDVFKNITRFTNPEDDFAVHAGTTLAAIKSGSGDIGQTYKQNPAILNTYKQKLLYNEPVFRDDMVCTADGRPYCIVHQYDRVNEWRDVLDRKYRQ